MKFIGLFKGEFKIVDNADQAQLEALDADFAWIDIDRIDVRIEHALKQKFGIESISETGFPTIADHDKYDLILLNYFEQHSKKELQILVSDKFIITVHTGMDSVSEAAMASVNEMLVSGGLNTPSVLYALMTAVLDRHTEHLKELRESLRSVDTQLKKGISKITYLSQLHNDAREVQRIFYDTRAILADMVLKVIPIKGIPDPSQFLDIYSRMGEISRGADDLSEVVDEYTNDLLPSIWKHMGRIKGMALGVAFLALSLGAASLFYLFFPDGIWGLEAVHVVLGIIAMGAIGLIFAQRRIKFKLS